MRQTILLAEDDRDIVGLLSLYLSGEGYRILSANDGRQALTLLETQKVDLAILDIMLPEIGGYDLLRRIRQRWNLPVIILSAKAQDADRILGLNLGADAYLTKPFHPLEVVAYVKAALRRYCQLGGEEAAGGEETLPHLTAGDLELDPLAMVLRKRGEEVPLTPTEWKILVKLMGAPGRVFTKAQLYACVGGEPWNDENTMMVHISNLRAKVEDDPSRPQYIKTVRGLGYRFEGP